ncbi:baseplate J/gp47 family protein [Salmonella enterica]
MFQLKNFVSIAASMLNYVRSTTGKVTDLQPGSVTRTILEAPAAEIEELYVQVFNGIREAIPVAVYNSIHFDKLPPQYASGSVTVIATTPLTQDLLVPKGTQFLARDGRIYDLVGDLIWRKSDTSMTFPVISRQPGAKQNLAAGEINASPLFAPGLFSFSSTAMSNGADTESDDERKTRFADYIQSLSRGTETALLYGARSARLLDAAGNVTESVTRASLKVQAGSVTVSIWGSNGAPSAALLLRANQIETGYIDPVTGQTVPGFTAAGVRCSVQPMTETTIKEVTFTLVMLAGFTLDSTTRPTFTQEIKDRLDSYLAGVMPGETVYVDDIRNCALLVRGVKSATVSGTQNITCGVGEILRAGKVTVA